MFMGAIALLYPPPPPPPAPTMAQSGQRAAKQHLKYPRSHSLKKKLTFLHQKLCQLKQSITDN